MRCYIALLMALLLPAAVFAQTEPGPPGPYVIDVRGAMVALPNAAEFYPTLPTGGTIPGRAFGLDVGGHLLGMRLGAARLGFGANVIYARGDVGPPDVSAKLTALAPQVSFNFGTGDGWSYLGGGYGIGRISTHVSDSATSPVETTTETVPSDPSTAAAAADAETGTVGTLNFGGGARWFVNRRVAAGFDVRLYRFGASSELGTPSSMRVALSVGLSLR